MKLVTGINAFRGIPGKKVDVEFQTAYFLEDRNAYFFGTSRIDG